MAFLLQLAGSEDHVNGPTATPDAALTLWKYAVFQVDYQAVEQHLCQYLPCYGQERDSSVVVTKLAISLFVEADDGRIFELLRWSVEISVCLNLWQAGNIFGVDICSSVEDSTKNALLTCSEWQVCQ